jgi:asparaginyl-tRNA synthetase
LRLRKKLKRTKKQKKPKKGEEEPKEEEKKKEMIPVEERVMNYSKDFFNKAAFLTVSGQLAVENYACALGNVYTFGPTFRAENSHTSRHLAEFWMIEPEIAFADLDDNMNLAEDYLKYCLKYVLLNNKDDIDYFVSEENRANKAAIKAKTKGFEIKDSL